MTTYGTMTTVLVWEQTTTVLVWEQTSMGNGTNTTEYARKQPFEKNAIIDYLQKICLPIIMLFGTFGNVMTILVVHVSGKRFGGPSMCVYFMCLALCDQTVLFTGLLRRWIINISGYDVRNIHVVVCKVHKFLGFNFSRIAAWILVAVTSQRVLAVVWPLRHRLTATKTNAIVVIVVIMVVCGLIDLQVLVLYTIKTKNGTAKCIPSKHTPQAAFFEDKVVPWLNSISGSFLPSAILVVNNIVLATKLWMTKKPKSGAFDSNTSDTRNKRATSLSLTLILTSVSFLLLTLPIPFTYFLPSFSGKYSYNIALVSAVLDLMLYTNNAINFYLYLLTTPKLRHVTIKLLCCSQWCSWKIINEFFSSRKTTTSQYQTSKTSPDRQLTFSESTTSFRDRVVLSLSNNTFQDQMSPPSSNFQITVQENIELPSLKDFSSGPEQSSQQPNFYSGRKLSLQAKVSFQDQLSLPHQSDVCLKQDPHHSQMSFQGQTILTHQSGSQEGLQSEISLKGQENVPHQSVSYSVPQNKVDSLVCFHEHKGLCHIM